MRCSIADVLPWPRRRRHRGTGGVAAGRRVVGLHRRRRRPLHLAADPRRRAAPRHRRRTPRRVSRRPGGGGSSVAGDGGERHCPGCWAGCTGPADVHLRVPGCSWRSPRPAPARPPLCAPSPWPGPKTAARWSASPRRLPRPLSSASRPVSAPTPSPNSPGRLQHGDLPGWAAAVGPSTLVIIDEAGMADILSLDAAVQFAIGSRCECPAGW